MHPDSDTPSHFDGHMQCHPYFDWCPTKSLGDLRYTCQTPEPVSIRRWQRDGFIISNRRNKVLSSCLLKPCLEVLRQINYDIIAMGV